MLKLFDDQDICVNKIYDGWKYDHNVMLQQPTGGGKSVICSHIVNDHNSQTAVIAHRKELVGQLSLSLAQNGIVHKIIGSADTVKNCVRRHMKKIGRSYYDPMADVGVISVDTLIARTNNDTIREWCERVTLWVIDEAHHVLRENKWGAAVEMFPHAKGLGLTATPRRADGKGLGRWNHGVFDTLVQGPTPRELINLDRLCDYDIAQPITTDLNLEKLKLTASGDHSKKELKIRFKASAKIVGDIVQSYLQHAGGEKGITFATDVESAHLIADKYCQLGVPAMAISAKSTDQERNDALDRLENGDLLQLVNVDLFGEGFDCPSISVVSFARKTDSLGMYLQQFGRGLRTEPGKQRAMIIDHVGNVMRHLLPDTPRVWSLEAREAGTRGKPDPDLMPLKRCGGCTKPYDAFHAFCPWCGYTPVPAGRSRPEEVDGQLELLSPEVLAAMRGEIYRVNRTPEELKKAMTRAGMAPVAMAGAIKNHVARSESRAKLIENIAWYGGVEASLGMSIVQSQRSFFHRFNIDVMSAQVLSKRDTEELNLKVWNYIDGRVNLG